MITKFITYKILRRFADDKQAQEIVRVFKAKAQDDVAHIDLVHGKESHVVEMELNANLRFTDIFTMGALMGGLIIEARVINDNKYGSKDATKEGGGDHAAQSADAGPATGSEHPTDHPQDVLSTQAGGHPAGHGERPGGV